MSIVLRLLRDELVDLCGKRGQLQEQIRQLEERMEIIQREQKMIEEADPEAAKEAAAVEVKP